MGPNDGDTQKANGETVGQQPQENAPEAGQHELTFTFAGPDSTTFRVNRNGVNPLQLAVVEVFVRTIVEAEMMQIALQLAAKQESSRIAVPGRPIPYSRDPRKRR